VPQQVIPANIDENILQNERPDHLSTRLSLTKARTIYAREEAATAYILAADRVIAVGRRVGMLFQKSNPLARSIYAIVVYGVRVAGTRDRATLDAACERALRSAALWDEVKDRLASSGLSLSGGQQQRLCIARTIAIEPDIILMDEPCSALDPIATQRIEELIQEIKPQYTIVMVTHNLQQAARVSDQTAFFWLGKLVEFSRTVDVFTNPGSKHTEDYVTGRFG
jgi:phosphate transport system ATP-binding protein